MNGEKVEFVRRYRHHCPARELRDVQIPQEICPDCGQKGEFWGWYQGMFTRMGNRSLLLGYPCTGIHTRFLPGTVRGCPRCDWEGIVMGEEFDYVCPECHGLGGYRFRNEVEMDKIIHWASARHQREITERPRRQRKASPVPANPVFASLADSDPLDFWNAIEAMSEDSRLYGERNRRIGELILPCDYAGWVAFMEAVEIWEAAGGRIEPGQSEIRLLSANASENWEAAALLPPGGPSGQGIRVNQEEIRTRRGMPALRRLHRRFPSLREVEFLPVDERFRLEEAQRLFGELSKLID